MRSFLILLPAILLLAYTIYHIAYNTYATHKAIKDVALALHNKSISGLKNAVLIHKTHLDKDILKQIDSRIEELVIEKYEEEEKEKYEIR